EGEAEAEGEGELVVSVRGRISNANFSTKKATHIFFINNRLVESPALKKTIEAVYCEVLPRHQHPFIHLSFTMPPADLDVNVHPTKKEVHFLHEEALLLKLHEELYRALRGANQSRCFQLQTSLHVYRPYEGEGAEVGMGAVGAGADTGEDTASASDFPSASASASALGRGGGGGSSGGGGGGGGGGIKRGLDLNSFRSSTGAGAGAGAGTGTGGVRAVAPNKHVRVDPSLVKINTVFRPATQGGQGGQGGQGTQGGYSQGMRTQGTEWAGVDGDGDGEVDDCACDEPLLTADAALTTGTADTASQMQVVETEMGQVMDVDADADADNDADTDFAPAGGAGGPTTITTAPAPAPAPAPASAMPGAFALNCRCCGKNARRKRGHATDGMGGAEAGAGGMDGAGGGAGAGGVGAGGGVGGEGVSTYEKLPPLVETSCQYLSVQCLLRDIKAKAHRDLTATLRQHVYVGAVDCFFSLIQQGTRLLMVDHAHLLKDLFYQLALRRFGEVERLTLNPPLPLLLFLRGAIEAEAQAGRVVGAEPGAGGGGSGGGGQGQGTEGREGAEGQIEKLAQAGVALLLLKAPLLDEYFGIKIDETGSLHSLPSLVAGHCPLPDGLPYFLLSLYSQVDWSEETACFRTIALALGEYYSALPTDFPVQRCLDAHTHARAAAAGVGAGAGGKTGTAGAGTGMAAGAVTGAGVGSTAFPQLTPPGLQTLSSLLYPALRAYLLPHVQRTADTTVVQIANLDHLYKAFERC
ncbi:DNA mismatch repair protein, partial [Ochromonadaceae sp. CCMP2298]